ncbi:copper chaperone PCu(A)C [Neisseriaceae bacterium JH1-16]|nr:copper chaperone PCu(A)C [Neisseriaceae bacterium JH1-16]
MLTRLAAAVCLCLSLPAFAHDVQAGSLTVSHPWSRSTAPTVAVGGAYLSVVNHGKEADTLLGASSPRAGMVELHQNLNQNGVMKMRELKDGLAIAPGQTVTLQPGGAHLMLMNLAKPLKNGEHFPLTLTFKRAGKVTVEVTVDDTAGAGDAHAH